MPTRELASPETSVTAGRSGAVAAGSGADEAARGAGSLRVLHVISSLAVSTGGPPAVCVGLAGAQAARGMTVGIATIDADGEKCVETPRGVELFCFPATGSRRRGVSAGLAQWLTAHAREWDVMHLHSVWQAAVHDAAKACWKSGTPYVVLLNGMLDRYSVGHRHYWLKRAYWLLRERRVMRRAAGLHCLNEAEIRNAVEWIADLPKFVCPNGIFERELAELPARGAFRAARGIGDRPMALFLSRVDRKKGLDRLLPEWKTVAARVPGCVLVIAGKGDAAYEGLIDGIIEREGLGQSVMRVGQIAGLTKWQALVDADVFVLPSHQEGFSMAITESLAAGVPAVATTACNYVELTTEQCGVEVGGGDMQAFAGAVTGLLTDAPKRQEMGARGAQLVRERFTWEKIAAGLEREYRRMVRR